MRYVVTGLIWSMLCLTSRPGLLSAGSDKTVPAQTARGIVYHDVNGNERFDQGETVLPGIRVSNGRDVVTTDSSGRYELPVSEDTILFVLKPRGWRTPICPMQLPRFHYIHKPHGSPALKYGGVAPTGPLPDSIDFPLYPQDEPDSFRVVMFGDTQPRNRQEVDYAAHDVVEQLIGTDAAFGITLGDLMFDDLSLFEPQARVIALLGLPWYNVIGNHDLDFDATTDRHSDETFERVFGPSYYSFDYGPVHFLIVDNVEWSVDSAGKGSYRGGIGETQLEFIRQNLRGIPADRLIVVCMHIPITGVHDRHALYRLLETRPHCVSFSAHLHTHEHRFIGEEDGWRGSEPHHHVVNVTVCGSWWRGTRDERGIPHATMADGAPNGYSILNIQGTDYQLDFHAAARPADYQMQIHAPEEVSRTAANREAVLVNVFNGSARSTVQMRVGEEGIWADMEQTRVEDPAFRLAYDSERELPERNWIELPKPAVSSHIWSAPFPDGIEPGTHLLHIRTRDMHGREFTGRRVIRVSP
jgi:hypothetical protein